MRGTGRLDDPHSAELWTSSAEWWDQLKPDYKNISSWDVCLWSVRTSVETHLWRRWALFRRHTHTENPMGPGTWRSSTLNWSIWEGSWLMPNCKDNRTVCVFYFLFYFSCVTWLGGGGTDLDCLFLLGSSAAKMWTVPWSLDTQMRDASWLKLMLKWKTKKAFKAVAQINWKRREEQPPPHTHQSLQHMTASCSPQLFQLIPHCWCSFKLFKPNSAKMCSILFILLI